jgi:hypothetical protein
MGGYCHGRGPYCLGGEDGLRKCRPTGYCPRRSRRGGSEGLHRRETPNPGCQGGRYWSVMSSGRGTV